MRVDWPRKSMALGSLLLPVAGSLVGCGDPAGEGAIDSGDPLHEFGITLPPEELGLPPRVSFQSDPDFTPAVAPPPFSPGIFPCSRCHEGGPEVIDSAPAMPHTVHVEEDLDCGSCHFPGDATEPRAPGVNACFLCHQKPDDEEEPSRNYFLAIQNDEGAFAFPRRWKTEDVIVGHALHEEKGVQCAECHGETSNDPHTKPKPLTLMQLCIDCHETRSVANECATCHSEIREPTHKNISLDHGPRMTDCFQCHNPEDRDLLRLANGETLTFDKSYELCGQCHGPRLRDWREGLHGKRVGFWDGSRRYLLCVHCHQNPHRPSFPEMEPMPPPLRPEEIR